MPVGGLEILAIYSGRSSLIVVVWVGFKLLREKSLALDA